MPTVQLLSVSGHVVPMRTRFPFRYGIAAMTSAPHLFLRAEVEVDGKPATGAASEGLPPKWFTKNPATTFEQDLPDMQAAIRQAGRHGVAAGKAPSFFDWWLASYQAQAAWAAEPERRASQPPLLAHLGTSLIERAVLDAVCRAAQAPLAKLVREERLGIRLDALHPELKGRIPSDLLPPARPARMIARHTVGLSDPLTDAEIPAADDARDGLPQSLEACIRAYGLTHFKIKLSGQPDRDRDRLRSLAGLLGRLVPGHRYTLDGNEQFHTLATFREHWEAHLADPALAEFLSPKHLLFVEQPVHRDHALDDGVARDLAAWKAAPPLIIDESDGETGSARRALELGYRGTSHKNCKGVAKGLANACLLRHRDTASPAAAPHLLSGEDLANVGPVALLQDFAVMHLLGLEHVERNGHHYFKGLSPLPGIVQEEALAAHGDLYQRQAGGFPALAIEQGQVRLESVLAAPFGTAFPIWPLLEGWTDLQTLEIRTPDA